MLGVTKIEMATKAEGSLRHHENSKAKRRGSPDDQATPVVTVASRKTQKWRQRCQDNNYWYHTLCRSLRSAARGVSPVHSFRLVLQKHLESRTLVIKLFSVAVCDLVLSAKCTLEQVEMAILFFLDESHELPMLVT